MKKKIQERIQAVLKSLGLAAKVENKQMTNDDWSRITAEYKETYGTSLEEDLTASTDEEETVTVSAEAQQQIFSIAQTLKAETEEDDDEEEEKDTKKGKKKAENNDDEEEEDEEEKEKSKKTTKKSKKTASSQSEFEASINTIATLLPTILNAPESSKPVATVKMSSNAVTNRVLGMVDHTEKYLFGIDNKIFSRSSWFNQSIVSKKPYDTAVNTQQVEQFASTFNDYAKSIANRANYLTDTNQIKLLNYEQMAAGSFSIQYQDLTIKFGEEYLVRRQDMIIAYLRTLPSVNHVFPWRSGIQDGEYVPTAFFGEFSQRYQAGEIFKGSVALPPQIARVSDVMVKYKFEDLIALETQYIGYLNKEHSNVMKWAFIEWLLVHIYTQMLNEQNRRRVVGVLVPIQKDVDNPAIFAADGALRAIEREEEELRVLPHKNLKTYTKSTIVDYVEAFFEEVNKVLPSLDDFKLHINKKHVPWYRQGFREKYSTDSNFTGTKLQAIDYSLENFIPVPNMDYTDYRMWITLPGNIESLQDAPNEMYDIYFERRLEALLAMSRWKEGSTVNMSGMPCASEAELEATKRKFQYIFTNYPVTELAQDASVIDANLNTYFLTTANSDETEITEIKNYVSDRVIKVICGSTENPTTIKKSGKFSKIASAWTPIAVGQWIKLYPELHVVDKTILGKVYKVTEPSGNWLELGRSK